MCKAYTLMQLRRMDMNNRIFETEVSRVLTDSFALCVKTKSEPLYPRFLRYLEESHRDGVIGDARYAVALGKAKKLHRFLTIIGHTSLSAHDFTPDLVLEFRQFVYEEYKYVPLFPELYPRTAGHRSPMKCCCNSTVVHDLKLFQAFFAELENTGEIRRSPFRKISVEKRRAIMHVMYDDPIFLRKEELKQVMQTAVPSELQWAKDLFVLNCAIGCRIDRRVSLFCQDTHDNVYKPLYEVATSKLARKTHIDMLNKVQINFYVAGLHRTGSDAVFRYTSFELADRYALLRAALG